MARPATPPTDPWFYATWEGAELASLVAGSRLTLAQKLEWLEEMAEIARRLGALPEPGAAPGPTAPSGRP